MTVRKTIAALFIVAALGLAGCAPHPSTTARMCRDYAAAYNAFSAVAQSEHTDQQIVAGQQALVAALNQLADGTDGLKATRDIISLNVENFEDGTGGDGGYTSEESLKFLNLWTKGSQGIAKLCKQDGHAVTLTQ